MSIELGVTVRDRRSGLVGKVIGRVEWLDNVSPSLVIQPPASPTGTVPPTSYVPDPNAEVVPQPYADYDGVRLQ